MDHPKEVLIKHFNNPASPKQKKKFAEVTGGIPLPAIIDKIQGANKAIQAVMKAKKQGITRLGFYTVMLPYECFVAEYTEEGLPKRETLKGDEYCNGVSLDYFRGTEVTFSDVVGNITAEVNNPTPKAMPKPKPEPVQEVDPFDMIVTVRRRTIV